MIRHIMHAVLSLILALAATDYVWIPLFNSDEVVLGLEPETEEEKEKEKEELREGRSSENKHAFPDGGHWLSEFSYISFVPLSYDLIKASVDRFFLPSRALIHLFILHCQLLLDC